jgi:hypothetical protein
MADLLNKTDLDSVFWFRRYRDPYKAAEHCGIPRRSARAHFNRAEIQEELERQDNAVIAERARIQVHAENLTNDLLDKELLTLVTLDEHVHPEAKRKAIELGYILTGRIESGGTRSLEAKEGPDAKPNFYQAFVQVGGSVTVSPILPPEHQTHAFPIAPPPAKPESTSEIRTGRMKIG